MCISNEPGYYLQGEFGMRIENLVLVVCLEESENDLKFENLTSVPYEKNLLQLDLLSKEVKNYINNYHEKV